MAVEAEPGPRPKRREMSVKYFSLQSSYKSDILTESMQAPSPEASRAAPPTAPAPPAPPSSRAAGSAGVPTRQEPAGAQAGGAEADLESGVAAVAGEARAGSLGELAEDKVIDALLGRNADVLLLAKFYARDLPRRFVQHAARHVARGAGAGAGSLGGAAGGAAGPPGGGGAERVVDLVVIGGGLAGLSAALTVLDRGGTVVVLEKQGHLGGNSAWASSGVNAVDVNNTKSGDSVASFTADTLRGAQIPNSTLIPVLTAGSVDSLAWLRSRLAENLELDLVGQMGGHSFPRTHRPSQGLAGSAIIFALEKQLKKYLHKTHDGGAQYELRKWTRATSILTSSDGATVAGVSYGSVTAKDPDTLVATGTVMARHVLIATGGYASDYTETSLLQKHRPDLLKYATTNNKGTTGDGHKLALAVGAKAVDLDDVQVHPTGFHNPADPDNKVKQLCAEILRGEGAILLSRQKGERFADELGTRDYVTGRMIETDPASLLFALVLNAAAAAKAATHISLYTKKKLIFKFETLEDLAAWDFWGEGVKTASLDAVMRGYDAAAVAGVDSFGKTFFHNTPFAGAGPFYAGIVTPVIHYCMGGIAIGTDGSVLNHEGAAIPGLFAAGEVIGGLHGRNRLGGNALSECVVFGRVIGEALPLGEGSAGGGAGPPSTAPGGTAPGGKGAAPGEGEGAAAGAPGLRSISKQELGQHKTEESCWVSIQGKIYDFTSFLDEHPAGAEAILKYGGEDGTEIFEAIHTQEMLDDFTPIGLLAAHQPSAAL